MLHSAPRIDLTLDLTISGFSVQVQRPFTDSSEDTITRHYEFRPRLQIAAILAADEVTIYWTSARGHQLSGEGPTLELALRDFADTFDRAWSEEYSSEDRSSPRFEDMCGVVSMFSVEEPDGA